MADDPTFSELFEQCTRSALHLEMRDGYMRDDPKFIAWRAGRGPDPGARRESWWRPWLDVVAGKAGQGVDIRRARIISEPISDYVRFEYDLTFTNIAAGEQIRWLPRRQATSIALPGNDFWLFDHEIVLVNHFSGDGDWTGSELIREADVIKLCFQAFEAVWERAVPHDNYRPA